MAADPQTLGAIAVAVAALRILEHLGGKLLSMVQSKNGNGHGEKSLSTEVAALRKWRHDVSGDIERSRTMWKVFAKEHDLE